MEKRTIVPLLLLPLCLLSTAAAYNCLPRDSSHFYIPSSPSIQSVQVQSSMQSSPLNAVTKPLSFDDSSPSPSTVPPPPPTPAAPAAPAANPLFPFLPPLSGVFTAVIKPFCDRTTYPDVCMSSVQPFLPTAGGSPASFGLAGVLELQMKAAKNMTALAVATFEKVAKTPGTNPALASTLLDCKGRYSDCLDNYDTALQALAAKDIPTVQTYLSAVLTGYDGCGGGDAPGDPVAKPQEPWWGFNDKLTKLADNCLDICVFLK